MVQIYKHSVIQCETYSYNKVILFQYAITGGKSDINMEHGTPHPAAHGDVKRGPNRLDNPFGHTLQEQNRELDGQKLIRFGEHALSIQTSKFSIQHSAPTEHSTIYGENIRHMIQSGNIKTKFIQIPSISF